MSDACLKIIRRAAFTATAWRNGGGVTHEAIRVPPTGEAFLWRVSVAQIHSSGAFSDFAGYDRTMVLLQGRGIALEFGSGERRALCSVGDWLEFDGGISTHCELLDGPCVDLNLMAAKSMRTAARIERLQAPLKVTAIDHETTLIFGIQDPLSLDDGTGQSARLGLWDLAILNGCSVHLSKLPSRENIAPSAVFIATISP
jgi:environmental stress-induced protein Ves